MSDLIRAHFGLGPYLVGWQNVQDWAPHVQAAEGHEALVAAWRVADDGPGYDRAPGALELVADVRQSWWERAAFAHHTVGEILCRDVLAHLSHRETEGAMDAFDFMLAPGGRLRLGVADVPATLRAMAAEPDEGRRRLLAATLRTPRSEVWRGAAHTVETLRHLGARYGFEFVGVVPAPPTATGIPRIEVEFQKPSLEALDPVPWRRLITPGSIADDWRCLEIGPGPAAAWPRANVVLDLVPRAAAELPPGAEFVQGDVCGPIPLTDKSVDFVLATHVLEHVNDPVAACRELSRVAKRGVVETPSPLKEALFGFEGAGHDHTGYPGHQWWVWPVAPDRLRFERPNPYFVERLRDRDVSAAMHQILRLGPGLGPRGWVLRSWFARNQAAWNTIARWEGTLHAEVVG